MSNEKTYFKLKNKIKLSEMTETDKLYESDFATITPEGMFVQLELVEETNKVYDYPIKPGIWTMQEEFGNLKLQATEFTKENLLDSFINTKSITDKIDCFFNRLHVYKEYGIEVPKRSALLYGPQGTGKTSSVKRIVETYLATGDTAIVIWPTDKFEAYSVKNFIKCFKYEGVNKLILIVEDIGGVEMDQVKMKSDSSLLSLLDNQEKTFKIPVYILATTNFPEIFLGNLTNRPGRFDDKIEMPNPDAGYRTTLLKFFYKKDLPENVEKLIASERYKDFSPAHLKESVLRSALHDVSLEQALISIHEEISTYNKDFQKKGKIGFESYED